MCPICKQSGEPVQNITVKHLVNDNLMEMVGGYDYYLCVNEACDVVYYNTGVNILFFKLDLKAPVWYKAGANPKFICYCNRVTEEQIIDAVINKDAKDMKDIIKLTGAMKNGQCLINNPTGKCCGTVIQKTIDKALNKLATG